MALPQTETPPGAGHQPREKANSALTYHDNVMPLLQ